MMVSDWPKSRLQCCIEFKVLQMLNYMGTIEKRVIALGRADSLPSNFVKLHLHIWEKL